MGPVASQEAIKELGTNGGGFFNANSAHPFENPTPLTNFLEMVLIFAIPAALTYTYGRMASDQRQGWALFARDGRPLPRRASASPTGPRRRPTRRCAALAVDQRAGNMEGKEVRFGVASSALFATVTTDASCGAVNAMHDSFTPARRAGAARQHPARRGDLRRRRRGPLRDAGLRAPDGLHRRADGRPHAGVPRQEDRGARDEARHALRAHLPARHPAAARGLGRGRAATARHRSSNARPARPVRDPLRLHERARQQRLGVRRPQRQHAVLERRRWRLDDARRPLPDDRPGARASPARWSARRRVAARARHVPHQRPALRRPPRRGDPHRRRAHVLPGALARPDRRALRWRSHGRLF